MQLSPFDLEKLDENLKKKERWVSPEGHFFEGANPGISFFVSVIYEKGGGGVHAPPPLLRRPCIDSLALWSCLFSTERLLNQSFILSSKEKLFVQWKISNYCLQIATDC